CRQLDAAWLEGRREGGIVALSRGALRAALTRQMCSSAERAACEALLQAWTALSALSWSFRRRRLFVDPDDWRTCFLACSMMLFPMARPRSTGTALPMRRPRLLR